MILRFLRNQGVLAFSVLLAAGGALGIAVLPWETVGAPVLAALLAGSMALGLALADSPAEERRFVFLLLLAAMGMRILATAFFYGAIAGDEGYLYSDANTYDRVAWLLARTWRSPAAGVGGASPVDFVLDDLFPRLLAGLYFLLGHVPSVVIVLNIVLGVSSVYLTYRIASMLFGAPSARWAGWLTALYTGFWLWEMMTLKDALFLFLILLFFLGVFRLWSILLLPERSPAKLWSGACWTAVLVLVFLAAGELRDYMPVILAGAVVLLPLIEFFRAGRLWRGLLILGTGAVLLVLLWPSISSHRLPAVALGSQSELFRVAEVPDTQTVGVFLEWIFAHPIGFLTYLALAMFSTALAPYAWLFPGVLPEVPRFETYMIAYPGMWMWYLLIPFSLLGLREAVRRSKGEAWPLIFYAASVFLIVSLFIPREARHRDMIMPIALLLAAVGLVYCRRWWILGLVVWTPLVGFAAWKLHSIGPILLAAVAAGAAVLSARYVRMHRLRAARLVRIE